jgi:hypothetical protein
MSWGYFADLRLSLPTSAWESLQSRKPLDFRLEKGWSGLEDASLETSFGRPNTGAEDFANVLAWDCYEGPEAVKQVETNGDGTTVRVCLLLDKSLLDLAFPLASLFEAARASGGSGTLRLVNDGTYSGEDGVELELQDGAIAKKKLENCWEINERLANEIYNVDAILAADAQGTLLGVNPFTGQPILAKTGGGSARKKGAAKKAAKKGAAKKAAPKKGAAKKAAPKKGAAKKAAPKKAARKTAPKKTPVAKGTRKSAGKKVPPKKTAKAKKRSRTHR